MFGRKNTDRRSRLATSVKGATAERSSLTDFVVEVVGSAEDELAASVVTDRKLERISYNRLYHESKRKLVHHMTYHTT